MPPTANALSSYCLPSPQEPPHACTNLLSSLVLSCNSAPQLRLLLMIASTWLVPPPPAAIAVCCCSSPQLEAAEDWEGELERVLDAFQGSAGKRPLFNVCFY